MSTEWNLSAFRPIQLHSAWSDPRAGELPAAQVERVERCPSECVKASFSDRIEEYREFYTHTASHGEQHATAHSSVVTRDLWTRLDADADSKISLAEASGDASLSGSFDAMDSNDDGFVTQAEYTAYAKLNK
jgi:hypothetical protein